MLHSQPGSLFLNQEHRCWIAIFCVLHFFFEHKLVAATRSARAVRPIFLGSRPRALHRSTRGLGYTASVKGTEELVPFGVSRWL